MVTTVQWKILEGFILFCFDEVTSLVPLFQESYDS